MTPALPHPQRCDIEDQCQHFCVYKQMICPVYIRHSTTPSEREQDVITLIKLWIFDYQKTNGDSEIDPEQLRDMLKELRTTTEAHR